MKCKHIHKLIHNQRQFILAILECRGTHTHRKYMQNSNSYQFMSAHCLQTFLPVSHGPADEGSESWRNTLVSTGQKKIITLVKVIGGQNIRKLRRTAEHSLSHACRLLKHFNELMESSNNHPQLFLSEKKEESDLVTNHEDIHVLTLVYS